MIRKFFVCLFLIALVSTNLYGTITRMDGLGSPYGFIEDDIDIYFFPARIFANSDMVIGELYNTSNSNDWLLRSHFSFLDYKASVSLNAGTGIIDEGSMDISKSTDFIFGFSENFALGFASSHDHGEKTEIIVGIDDQISISPEANYYSLSGGYSKDALDLGLKLIFSNVEDLLEGNTDFPSDKYTMDNQGLGLLGRYFIKKETNYSLVTTCNFTWSSYEYSYLNRLYKTSISDDLLYLDFGIGYQVRPNNRNLIFFNINPIIYQYNEHETIIEEEETYTVSNDVEILAFPNFNIGLESKICNWLTGRLGAKQTHQNIKANVDRFPPRESTSLSSFSKEYLMNIGLTFNFSNFSIDTLIEHDLLFHGPNFIGGHDNGLATQISIKYVF